MTRMKDRVVTLENGVKSLEKSLAEINKGMEIMDRWLEGLQGDIQDLYRKYDIPQACCANLYRRKI